MIDSPAGFVGIAGRGSGLRLDPISAAQPVQYGDKYSSCLARVLKCIRFAIDITLFYM